MDKEYRARTLKSGNSVALQLPKRLEISEGVKMIVREEHGQYIAVPVDVPRPKIKGDWIGGRPWLEPLKPENGVLEDSPRSSDNSAWPNHGPSDK